jgi:transposase InsO family protein
MDGSNFRAWFREICEFALMSLDDADFYLKDMRRDIRDPIARTVILSSINRSFRSPYYDFRYSFEIMRELKQRYVVFSRGGQLNLWNDLLHIKCDESTAAAEVSASFRNKIIDLAEAGLTLTEDNIMGLMLHSSLTRGSPLRQEFDRRVDQELTGRQRRVLEFSEMIDLLTDCQEKVRADNSSNARTPNPSAFAVEEQPSQPNRSASVKSHPDNIYVMASRPGRPPSHPPATYHGCFCCGSTAHLIAQCPSSRSHTGPPHFSNGGYQHSHHQMSNGSQTRFPPIIRPPGYQAHYPVLTPSFPGYSSGAPPTRGLPPRQTGPTNPNLRPADYYRPSYGQQTPAPPARPSAREADVTAYDIQQDTAMDYPHYLDNAPAEFAVASSSAEHRDHVLFDTGATHHVTGDRSALTEFEMLTEPIPLKVATNGTSCVITAQGTLTFCGPGSTPIRLEGVLFCKHVSHTLVLPVALRLAGFTFTYDCNTDSFLIFFRGHLWTKSTLHVRLRKWFLPSPIKPIYSPVTHLSTVAPCTVPHPPMYARSSVVPPTRPSVVSPDPVYSFNVVPLANDEEPFKVIVPAASNLPYMRPQLTSDEKTLLQIHKRFGHVGLRVIRRMMTKHAALGLPESLPAGNIICPSCMISKSVNRNTLTSDQRTFEPMDAWNVDLIGPFETPALGGGLYVLSMRDIGSGYAEIKILTKKSEALDLLKDTITRMETFTKRRMKILRSDNGGEFNSKALSAFLASKGIVAERSIAYHHYQNGCIERFNRTLQDMGRTLLVDSTLPNPYWALAFVWACYTLNRIPNSASGDVTPYEKMFGFAPNLDRLRPFGAQAFTHIPVEKRKKLDDRAYMGYAVYYLPNSKGWGFWVPSINDFVESAVATFPDFP